VETDVSLKTEVDNWVQATNEDVIAWRRHLHKHPELSFEETETAQFVYDTLSTFPNLELSRPTKTSVMARLLGDAPGKVLAFRADMDALPIVEENTFDFASMNEGVMHACGHDGHTAMLLGAAKILSQQQARLKGEIRFLFQHAEELFPGGAEEMVAAGVVDGVDMVVGAHLWASMPVGLIGVMTGPMMAAPDTFSVTVQGRGGHAAVPQETVDSIAVAAQVVTNLQHIVARNMDPLDPVVLSVTKFIGGTADNVIPGSVSLVGTVRSFDPKLRETVPTLMERVIKGVTAAHGATYKFAYVHGYRPVINDSDVTALLQETISTSFGPNVFADVRPTMGGEDFSAFQQKAAGSFFWIGAGNEEAGIVYPHHHARFTVDESAFATGVKCFVQFALRVNDGSAKA